MHHVKDGKEEMQEYYKEHRFHSFDIHYRAVPSKYWWLDFWTMNSMIKIFCSANIDSLIAYLLPQMRP